MVEDNSGVEFFGGAGHTEWSGERVVVAVVDLLRDDIYPICSSSKKFTVSKTAAGARLDKLFEHGCISLWGRSFGSGSPCHRLLEFRGSQWLV